MTNLSIVKPNLSDIERLHQFCTSIYSYYFGDYWTNHGLESYLQEQFGIKKLEADLKNSAIDYFFIQLNQEIVGFIKINNKKTLGQFNEPTTSELEKMYILPNYTGMSIGKKALKEVIKSIRQKGQKLLFLEVLDTNKGAIEFYQNIGFRFHSRALLKYDQFTEEHRGLNYMFLELD